MPRTPVEKLKSRKALAEGEAEYLSQFNAHILGHSNINQRIYYVDRIRKELSDTKQVRSLLVPRYLQAPMAFFLHSFLILETETY